MAQNACATCAWEASHGMVVDTSRSHVAWASLVGVSEGSIRRHLAHPPRTVEPVGVSDQLREEWSGSEGTISAVITEDVSPQAILAKFGHDTSRVSIVETLEETHWQNGSGEWQHRYKFKTRRDDTGFDIDELVAAIGGIDFSPEDHLLGDTFIFCPADFQVGKANELGGTDALVARVQRSISGAVEFALATKPKEIVILEAGDLIENLWNTSEQIGTNDLSLTEQVRVARRIMLEMIANLAPLTTKLTYAAVPSNHGRNRVGFKAPAGDVADDWGLEVSYQLEDACRHNPTLSHVWFVRPEGLEDSLTVATYDGTVIGLAHGHQASSSDKLGDYWKGQDHGHGPLREADILVCGHWHSFRVQHSGNARWVMVVPTSDNGSAWFSTRTGERSKTGVLGFTVKDGQWDDLRIY